MAIPPTATQPAPTAVLQRQPCASISAPPRRSRRRSRSRSRCRTTRTPLPRSRLRRRARPGRRAPATTGAIGRPAQKRSRVIVTIDVAEEWEQHQPGERECPDDDPEALVPRRPEARRAGRPTSEPAAKPASAMPASARLPSPSAKAGTAISRRAEAEAEPEREQRDRADADRREGAELRAVPHLRRRALAHRRDAGRRRTSRPRR